MDISSEELRDIAYKFALKNAVEHKGKCNKDSVRNLCISYLKKQGYTIDRKLLDRLEEVL